MADDTAAALQALIKQVSTLTDTVEKQNKQIDDQNARLDSLHEFNGRVLNQKKDLERQSKTPPKPEDIKKMADMGYEPDEDGNWYKIGTKPTHTLTREEARDPRKYAEAKAAAEKAGTTLQIVDPNKPEDTHRRPRGEIAETHTTLVKDEDQKVAYMRRDAMTDPRSYQRLRADGFTVQQWDQPDDLPDHMQTKLNLMEKAHAADT